MTNLEVTFDASRQLTVTNRPLAIAGDNTYQITATFPTLTGTKLVYLEDAKGGTDYYVLESTADTITWTIPEEHMFEGTTKVMFEIRNNTSNTRFQTLNITVTEAVYLSGSSEEFKYTTTVSLNGVTTLEAGQQAYAENIGTAKDMKLNLYIPKGWKGEKPEVRGHDGYVQCRYYNYETATYSDWVNMISYGELNTDVGLRTDLTTDVTTTIVAAVNGVNNRISNIITTPAETVTAQEIIDARKGETSLGDKISKIDTRLEDIVVNVKDYGATGDGVTDDTSSINSALSSIQTGQILYFPKGKYVITSKLIINKRIDIKGETYYNTIIQNNGTDDGIYITSTYVNVKNILISGNTQSKSGLVIGSTNCNIENVLTTENGEHGIKLLPNVWLININQCYCFNNRKSGIYAVSGGGLAQLNAVNIIQTNTWNNDEHGMYITGTNINIKDCQIEGNLKAGIFISTYTFSVYKMSIFDNYFEANKDGHIVMDLYPSLTYKIYGLSIGRNYFYLPQECVNAGVTSVISAKTDTAKDGIYDIHIESNNLFFAGTLKHVDLGNTTHMHGSSRISTVLWDDTSDFSTFYVNLGACGVDNPQKTLTVNGYLQCKGISYNETTKSVNILSDITTSVAYYPMPLRSGQQFIKAGVFIETDSTNYGVTFSVLKRVAANGVGFSVGVFDSKTGNSGSKYVEMSRISYLVDVNNGRVNSNEEFILKLTFTNSDASATNFSVHSPVITYND